MSKTTENKKRRKAKEPKEHHRGDENLGEVMKSNVLAPEINITVPFDLTQRQQLFYRKIMDKHCNIMFCAGPAGTSKTFIAVYAALSLVKNNMKDNIIYVRSAVESSDSKMGFLPGEADDKFQFYTYPLYEKLGELIPPPTIKWLCDNKVISAESTCFMRGRTLKDAVVIIDEPQNMTKKELLLLLTRFGKNTKMILVGDFMQSDIKKNDYLNVYKAFSSNPESRENGFDFFQFTKDDIVRSPIIKHIATVFEDMDIADAEEKEKRKQKFREPKDDIMLLKENKWHNGVMECTL